MPTTGVPLLPEVDPPPDEVVQDLAALRNALDQVVPTKELDRNLLIGTWNLRMFGGLTKK